LGEGVLAGQRGMEGGKAYQCLVGAGGHAREGDGAGAESWGPVMPWPMVSMLG